MVNPTPDDSSHGPLARMRAMVSDWRYPAALAAVLLVASVLLAQVITLRGYRNVLDGIEERSTAAECVDLLEAEFDQAIVDLLEADSDAAEVAASKALEHATDEHRVGACYKAAETEEQPAP